MSRVGFNVINSSYYGKTRQTGVWLSGLVLGLLLFAVTSYSSTGVAAVFPTPVETDACCLNEIPGLELTLAADQPTPQRTNTLQPAAAFTPVPSSTSIPLPPSGEWAINPDNAGSLEKLVEVKPARVGIPHEITWSPDGKRLAVSGNSGLALLNGETLELERVVETSGIYSRLTFNADGTLLAASGFTSGISQVWEVESGRVMQTFTGARGLSAISPDGKVIASLEEDPQYPESGESYQEVILRRFNMQTGEKIGETRGKAALAWWIGFMPEMTGMVFSPDGRTIQSVNTLGDIFLWNTADGRLLNTSFNNATRQRLSFGDCYSDDAGKTGFGVLCRVTYHDPPCTEDNVNCVFEVKGRYELGLWDTGQLRRLSNLVIRDPMETYTHVLIDRPANQAILVSDGQMEVWKFNQPAKSVNEISGDSLPDWMKRWQACEDCPAPLLALKPGSSTNLIAVSHMDRIELWDYAANRTIVTYTHPVQNVTSAAFGSVNGEPVLFSGLSGGSLERLNLKTDQSSAFKSEASSLPILHVASATDGKTLVIADKENLNWFSQATAGVVRQEIFHESDFFAANAETGLLNAGVSNYTEDGYYSGSTLSARDLVSGDIRWQQEVSASRAALSPDGLWLVSIRDADYRVFNALTGEEVLSLKISRDGLSPRAVAISPGGSLLGYSSYDGTFLLVDVNSGKVVTEVPVSPGINQITFHPSGCLLAAGDSDGAILIMETKTGRVISKFSAHTGSVKSLAFNPAGSLLLSTGDDGAARAWGQPGAQEWLLPAYTGKTCQFGEAPHPVTPTPTVPTATPVPATATPDPSILTRTLKLTSPKMTGSDVLHLQKRLYALGFTQVGTPDGIFGANTDQAVRSYQQNNGLEVDGIVGPATWGRLFSTAQ